MKIRNYTCVPDDSLESRVEKAFNSLGLKGAMDNSPEDIIKFYSGISKDKKDNLILYPLNHTVEISAYGGTVKTEPKSLSKNGEVIFEDLDDLLTNMNFNWEDKVLNNYIEGAKGLIAMGLEPVYCISGPLTILNGLIDISKVFKALRRDKEKVFEILELISKDLLLYIDSLEKVGLKTISFSDSIMSVDIIGPKYFCEILVGITLPFLKKIWQNKNLQVILCPKLSLGLMDCGLATLEELPVDRGLSYLKACKSISERAKIVGKICPKDENYCTDNFHKLNSIVLGDEK